MLGVFLSLLAVTGIASGQLDQGSGLVGYGRSVSPLPSTLCAQACRNSLTSYKLSCSTSQHAKRYHGGPAPNASPQCYASDTAFQTTLAWCIHSHCHGSSPSLGQIEDFWQLLSIDMKGKTPVRPNITYDEALRMVHEPPKTTTKPSGLLNRTSLVSDAAYEKAYESLTESQETEAANSRYAIIVMVSGFVVPIVFSWLRFVPWPARLVALVNAYIIDPALWGKRHKTPFPGNTGLIPTRGQSILIFYLVALNVIFCLVTSPWMAAQTTRDEILERIANRCGVLTFANITVMLLYSSRNNILLMITDWQHTTFLLLHRWIGYIAITEGAVHVIINIITHVESHSLASLIQRDWARYGAVAVCLLVAMIPFSILPVRQRIYEIFLAVHVVFAVLILASLYLHLYLRAGFSSGYQNLSFTMFAVWGFDRCARYVRLGRWGVKKAEITWIDDDYVRVDIPGVAADGHAYLYFPTLTWRFWENHPFSIASTMTSSGPVLPKPMLAKSPRRSQDPEKGPAVTKVDSMTAELKSIPESPGRDSDVSMDFSLATPAPVEKRLTFFIRAQTGYTSLTRHLFNHQRLPVLIEAGYGSLNHLRERPNLICIVGGAGISTVLPILRTHPGRTKLYWGLRTGNLLNALEPELRHIDKTVSVGPRLKVREILEMEFQVDMEDPAVVVSGPAALSDDVRSVVCELSAKRGRPILLVDESFSW